MTEELLDEFSIEEAPIRLYADDVTLSISGSDIDRLMVLAQNRINIIETWAAKHELFFAGDKTKAMLFTRKRNVVNGALTVSNTVIEWVQTHKHLGLVLHNRLNWKYHNNYVVDKVNMSLNQCKNMISQVYRCLYILTKKKIPQLQWCNITFIYLPKVIPAFLVLAIFNL